MLRITGPQHPANVEAEISRVLAAPGERLQLPVRPKDWWLGGELGLIELVITWARRTEQCTLVTHIGPNEDASDQLRSMARRMFGFTALMMAHEILDREETETRSLRREAYDQCRSVVEMMFEPIDRFALGAKVFLLCVDHSTRAAIPWLYAPSGAVGDRIAFITLTKELLAKATAAIGHSPVSSEMLPKVAAILHELFKNTDEWGRTDQNYVSWRRSVRGIAIERHSWSSDELEKIASDNQTLRAYFEVLRKSAAEPRLRFLELTVFDSGVGLARRWLDHSLPTELGLQEEYNACVACLMKHRTSSNKRDKGLGLAEVMATLSALRGFLKVRTGRLALYRDFEKSPVGSTADVSLWDFPSASPNLTELGAVHGTHYQILIPVF